MKHTTGIVRTPDRIGRINVPQDMLKSIGFSAEKPEPMEITCNGESITIRPYVEHCIFTGINEGQYIEYKGRRISKQAVKDIVNLVNGEWKDFEKQTDLN